MGTPDAQPDDVNIVETIDGLRLQIFDVAADLRPLPTRGELHGQLESVARRLRDITRDLVVVMHLESEDNVIEERLAEIDAKLADGWVPPARPVEDVLADLEREFA